MRLNMHMPAPTALTHEGASVIAASPRTELRKAVMACMLWENTFYEKGSDLASRIVGLGWSERVFDYILELEGLGA